MAGHVALDSDGDGRIAVVTLSHRAKFNAMSRAMWRELKDVFTRIQAGTHWRCVLLRGAGAHFCAGGDIAEYPDFRFDVAQLRAFHEDAVWGGLQSVLDCDVPIVAAIVGLGHNLGLELVAEGVETPAMAATLRELGCDEFQGWHYGRAEPADVFAARLVR